MANEHRIEARNLFIRELGGRLQRARDSLFGTRPAASAFNRAVASRIGIKADTLRRWYAGDHSPDAFGLAAWLEEFVRAGGTGYDADFLLFGKSEVDPKSELARLADKLDAVHQDVHVLANYVQDHELGIEGVVMRQSVRLLEDLRRTRPTHVIPTHQKGDWSSESDPLRKAEPLVAGILPDDLLELVEGCAKHVRLATLRLDYVVKTTQEAPTRIRPGRLLQIVAKNLERDCRYQYLLPERTRGWRQAVAAYKAALHSTGIPAASIEENLEFRVTPQPLGAGFLLLGLDYEMFEKERPFLAEELKEDYITKISKELVLGEVMPPSTKFHGSMLMDSTRVKQASTAWNKYWSKAEPVSPR